ENNAPRAVKEMSDNNLIPEERQKAINDFMREARMLSNLNHGSLAKLYDIFTEGDRYFLVMEYVEGHNLEDEMVVYKKQPLAWEDVVRWGALLCDVLAYLHEQQPPIIYRDLKPANVMLMPDNSIKLVDFGIARWLHPNRQNDTMKLGTDGYAPLEQYNAHSEPRSDLYALGASLYHLLTGRVPEAAPVRMAGGRMLTPIRSINPRVPEPVERVIHQALNLQAEDRFVDAAQMREALEWSYLQTVSGTGGVYPGYAVEQRASYGPALVTPRASGASATSGGIPDAATSPMTPMSPLLGAHPGPFESAYPGAQARRATGPAAPGPRLYVWPLRLDAGAIAVNQLAQLELEVANRGGGQLSGHTETNIACLSVEPALVDSATTNLRVRIDTTDLPVGPYVCHVAVRTNGGDQIIQVRFVVRPANDPTPLRRYHTGQ
ncbi:MAG: protein kinase, partial [Ktedonobacterales bacterium]